jgi:hypothetical protein
MKKIFSGNVKSQPDGEISCVFSTLEVIDLQGDITKKGAFGRQSVRIRPWNHDMSGPPIGEGVIEERGNQAIMIGHLFMSMVSARDHFEAMRALKSVEWSYQFEIDKYHYETIQGKSVRILEKLTVFSVDPVDQAAGIDTRLLLLKGAGGTWLSTGLSPANARSQISNLMPPQAGELRKALDDLCSTIQFKELETIEARLKKSGGPSLLDAWRLRLKQEGHSDPWIEAIIESEIAGLEKQVLDQNPLLEYQPGAAHAQVLRNLNRPVLQGLEHYPEAGSSVRQPIVLRNDAI